MASHQPDGLFYLGVPLPRGAPLPEVSGRELIQVFVLGGKRAVIVTEKEMHRTTISKPWLSVQDPNLAERLVHTIRDIHLKPARALLIDVSIRTQPALHKVLSGKEVFTRVMRKDVGFEQVPEAPTGVTFERMTKDEVVLFLAKTERTFISTLIENSSSPREWGRAAPEAKRALKKRLSVGDCTIGQLYFYIKDSQGENLAAVWATARGKEDKVQHLWCSHIEVEPGRRRTGLGRMAVGFLQYAAIDLEALAVIVEISGRDQASQALFETSGFTELRTVFRISE